MKKIILFTTLILGVFIGFDLVHKSKYDFENNHSNNLYYGIHQYSKDVFFKIGECPFSNTEGRDIIYKIGDVVDNACIQYLKIDSIQKKQIEDHLLNNHFSLDLECHSYLFNNFGFTYNKDIYMEGISGNQMFLCKKHDLFWYSEKINPKYFLNLHDYIQRK
jgi:hypothetical protein